MVIIKRILECLPGRREYSNIQFLTTPTWSNAFFMKYIFFFLILFSSKHILLANEITMEQARKVAMSFFFCETIRSRGGIPRLLSSSGMVKVLLREVDHLPHFYVFNRMDSDGFVIISGDDVTMPILGYSCSNHFVVENMPPNLLDWMDELRNQINAVRGGTCCGHFLYFESLDAGIRRYWYANSEINHSLMGPASAFQQTISDNQ